MLDRDADFGRLGIGEAGIEAAIAFHDQADDRTRSRIEQPRLDEDRVYRGIEQRVIDDVVEMAVGVVIAPARRQAHESGESRSGRRPLAIGVRRHAGFPPVLGAAPSLERTSARANQRDGEQGFDHRRERERRDARGERLLRANELGEPQKAKGEYDGVAETQRPEEPDPGAVPPPVGGKAD
jgi:hypothetical protein